MYQGEWTVSPCPHREMSALAEALGISETTASVLVRRGYRDPAEVRALLAGEQPLHDPFLLGDMNAASDTIRGAIAAGKRICVHGDYDVDGICATALALLMLRELGAEADWHLPSRFEEGYGVSRETLGRLAEEGCGLVLTVDCGITAVEEVAAARALGLEVVVSDHHRPAETVPDCPVVATRPSSYPFPDLCGTGVVYKLAQALLGAESDFLARQLDIVALATIADVVPLVGENRSLTIAGLRALARTQKPGLRALLKSSRVDPGALDAGAVGFRLAPRINAAGRLGHPAAALELLLTDDGERAADLAAQLEDLNRERQGVENRMVREAMGVIERWPEAKRRASGYVLAEESWHEGVIGIVAARLVDRFHRPVVLIAGGDEEWKGSGRSIPRFDLHTALGRCAADLERYGGHRAAAGLSIRPERIEAFAERFAAEAGAALTEEDLRPVTTVDAVVPASSLNLELCAELQRLGPFGMGNPGVTFVVTGCELAELATTEDGKHLRFRIRQNGKNGVGAIGFGLGSQLDRLRRAGGYDVAFRLEENQWNGMVAPQLVIKRIFDTPERYEELRARFGREWRAGRDGWTAAARAVFEELGLEDGASSWRSLLESPTFVSLLHERPLAEAA